MIVDKIAKTAETLKTENNVILSVVVPRREKLNEKTEEVNNTLVKACNQKEIDLIKHSNINIKTHLNRSKLRLSSVYNILQQIYLAT